MQIGELKPCLTLRNAFDGTKIPSGKPWQDLPENLRRFTPQKIIQATGCQVADSPGMRLRNSRVKILETQCLGRQQSAILPIRQITMSNPDVKLWRRLPQTWHAVFCMNLYSHVVIFSIGTCGHLESTILFKLKRIRRALEYYCIFSSNFCLIQKLLKFRAASRVVGRQRLPGSACWWG